MGTHKFAVGQAVSFRLIGIRNTRKGRASRSFACCLKQRMRSSIVSKARRTATSASFGKTNSRDHEKIEMPTIVLKIKHAPTDASDREASQSAGPLLRGTGDTDYLCGNCDFVIASEMGRKQRVPMDGATCPACGAENEFPPELRI